MIKIKLGDVLDFKRGMSVAGEFYSNEGRYVRLTLGNFTYPECGFKLNTSKDDLYYTGTIRKEFIMKKGDIITPLTEQVRGLLGNTATIPEDDLYIQTQDVAKLIPNEDVLDKKFAYYLVSSPTVKKQLDAGSQQTKIRHTSPDKLKDCYAYLPKLDIQKKIAKLMDSFGEKIENNNKIITELESMAKTLYDYWFLQFEFPNEEGKPYKSSGGKMVYNEELKREIPEGWMVKKLEKCIKHINTGLNPRDNFELNTGNIKYITVKNLTTKGTLDFSGCDTIDFETKQLINKRSKVSKGDILFASIAPLGRCMVVSETPDNWEINESVFSIRPDYSSVSTEYLYMFFMSDYFIKTAEHSSTGSIFSGIRVAVLNDMNTLVPTKTIMDKFTEYVKPLFNKKYFAEIETQELSSLRDFLLPMLMNGQVTFK